jgi:hypothetical protein
LTQLIYTYDIVCEGEIMPRGKSATSDRTTLAMALVGYELERQKIDEKIREIRGRLGVRSGRVAAASAAGKAAGPRHRRTLSAAARRRIAAAQRKRWAAHRKKLAQSGKG